jgi:hypothetical protein
MRQRSLGRSLQLDLLLSRYTAVFFYFIVPFYSFEALSRHIFVFVPQGPTEKEQIDVQGDISYDIVDFITDTWPDVIIYKLCLFLLIACFIHLLTNFVSQKYVDNIKY